eukprot:CAMPEP_0115030536 /NCGR_PEP_ID=MMETSP0216-20121206/37868_1 /TAXON_ID=223996 /ORGANISM="Protocruzia adherens, Strain Boccale" /LENGTH=587 /DNA_ID=CAMNT_0002407757 /DNA_START=121 /DNA_END=1883 /DNA_ORIENTATION=-
MATLQILSPLIQDNLSDATSFTYTDFYRTPFHSHTNTSSFHEHQNVSYQQGIVQDLTIRPLFCDQIDDLINMTPSAYGVVDKQVLSDNCVADDGKVSVFVKAHGFNLRFFQRVVIMNVVLDGSELMIWRQCSGGECCDPTVAEVCCDSDEKFSAGTILQHFSQGSDGEVAAECQLTDFAQYKSGGKTEQDSAIFDNVMPLFTLELDATLNSMIQVDEVNSKLTCLNDQFREPELQLIRVDFKNFWHRPTSVIYLKTVGKVIIQESNFDGLNSRIGIISNNFGFSNGSSLEEAFTGFIQPKNVRQALNTLKETLLVDKKWISLPFTCGDTNIKAGSVNLENTDISNINTKSGNLSFVDSEQKIQSGDAGVIDLTHFFGTIAIKDSTFQNLASEMFEGQSSLDSWSNLTLGGAVRILGFPDDVLIEHTTFNRIKGHQGSAVSLLYSEEIAITTIGSVLLALFGSTHKVALRHVTIEDTVGVSSAGIYLESDTSLSIEASDFDITRAIQVPNYTLASAPLSFHFTESPAVEGKIQMTSVNFRSMLGVIQGSFLANTSLALIESNDYPLWTDGGSNSRNSCHPKSMVHVVE